MEHFPCDSSENFFLSEVNNRETIAAIGANNNTYCFQKQIEKFPLKLLIGLSIDIEKPILGDNPKLHKFLVWQDAHFGIEA